MKLVIRIILALALVNSVAVGIGVVILLARYESMVSDLQVSRVAVTATAVKNTVESQLALGLQLQDAHDTVSVIARAAKRDPDLEAILVYDPDGRVLFANREALQGGTAPPQAVALLRGASGGKQVSWRDDGFGLVAVPLINSFGVPAGGLVLRFSRATPIRALESATEQLISRAIFVLLGSITLLGGATYLTFQPLMRLAREATAGLEAMAQDDMVVSLPSGGWLARELQTFEQDARLALSEINQADIRLESLAK